MIVVESDPIAPSTVVKVPKHPVRSTSTPNLHSVVRRLARVDLESLLTPVVEEPQSAECEMTIAKRMRVFNLSSPAVA